MLADVLGFLVLIVSAILLLIRLPAESRGAQVLPSSSGTPLWVLIAFLFVLPFVYAFGSTGGTFGAALTAVGVLPVAAMTAAAGIGRGRLQLLAATVVMVFTVLSVVSTLTFARQHPYRQPSIDIQTETLPVGSRGASLLVDPDLRNLLHTLRAQAGQAGWTDGTPLVGIARNWSSTVPYVLAARPPESLMRALLGYDSAQSAAEYNFGPRFPDFPWSDAWILTTSPDALDDSSRDIIQGVMNSLEIRTGRKFPAGYTCVAHAADSLLWKPEQQGEGSNGEAMGEDSCPPPDPAQSKYNFSGGWVP